MVVNKADSAAEEEMRPCRVARKLFKDPKLTQGEFGALHGKDKNDISKREKGRIATTPTAAALYNLVIQLIRRRVPEREIIGALETVPLELRSEEKALMALQAFADVSHKDAIRQLIGAPLVRAPDDSTVSNEDNSMVLEAIREEYEQLADESDDPAQAAEYREAASNIAQAIYRGKRAQKIGDRAPPTPPTPEATPEEPRA